MGSSGINALYKGLKSDLKSECEKEDPDFTRFQESDDRDNMVRSDVTTLPDSLNLEAAMVVQDTFMKMKEERDRLLKKFIQCFTMNGQVYETRPKFSERRPDRKIDFGIAYVNSEPILVLNVANAPSGGTNAFRVRDITLAERTEEVSAGHTVYPLKIECAGSVARKPRYKKTYFFTNCKDREEFVKTVQTIRSDGPEFTFETLQRLVA